jgi:superfamily I DNA/RNA helicase
MGVEKGVIPLPKAIDPNEERRLLYVAMTRAREYLFLTMARRRYGATARSGGGVLTDRERCPFFGPLGISPQDGWQYLQKLGA